MIWETWGRTNPQVAEVLAEWARRACGRRRAGSVARTTARWTAELDAALHVWMADAVLVGMGGRGATHWQQQRSNAFEHDPAAGLSNPAGTSSRSTSTSTSVQRAATQRPAQPAAQSMRSVQWGHVEVIGIGAAPGGGIFDIGDEP